MPHIEPPTETAVPTARLGISPRRLYRALALAEAVTWTLLIGGMIVKYVLEAGDVGVRVGGFLHGLVFLAYAMTALLAGLNQRWSLRLTAAAVLTAVIPYATIPFERWLDRHGRLDGPWHTTATGDPRDDAPARRLLRWMLRRPLLLSVGLLIALGAVMTVLLIVGPPGGRA